MENVFIARGHGYEAPTMPGMKPCTAFDGFDVIAEPVSDREARVWKRSATDYGITYGSHSIKLARRADDARSPLYILIEHGSGREVLRIPPFYDGGALDAAILAMPEREQYALIYTLYQLAKAARDCALSEESARWRQAHIDKRIKARRYPARGTAKVWIEPAREPGESDQAYELRKAFAAPSKR